MIQGVAAKWSFSSLSAIKEVRNDFLFFRLFNHKTSGVSREIDIFAHEYHL